MPMEKCHIWLARFASEEALDAYFEENYDKEDDDEPINKFALDQGETFYDHDWVERSFEGGGDLRTLIDGHSYSENYIDEVIKLAGERKIEGANAFIMADRNEFENPKAVEAADYQLWYVGVFSCDV